MVYDRVIYNSSLVLLNRGWTLWAAASVLLQAAAPFLFLGELANPDRLGN